MLAVGTAYGALEASSLESLHPDGNAVGIPVQELDAIASLVEEHEQAPLADISLEVVLDDAIEAVKALAHIDRLGVQVDGDRRAEGKHGAYATCSSGLLPENWSMCYESLEPRVEAKGLSNEQETKTT